jgi:14-3-3 protein epsilon
MLTMVCKRWQRLCGDKSLTQPLNREECVYFAKVAEQAERYPEMVEAMKQLVGTFPQELTLEERNLISVAFKNEIGSRRAAWRILSSIEQKEISKGSSTFHLSLIKGQIQQVQKEICGLADDVVEIMDLYCLPHSTTPEARVFFLKMKADYLRYKAEISTGQERDKLSTDAGAVYALATQIAEESLKSTNPIRLGLGLNYSVYLYEICNNPDMACTIAKKMFDLAIADLENIPEDEYKDATLIMQLFRDSMTLWTSEPSSEDENDGEIDQQN